MGAVVVPLVFPPSFSPSLFTPPRSDMSDVAGPSVISLNYDDFLPANDLPGPSLSHGFHDVYHEPGYLKDPARVSVPSSGAYLPYFFSNFLTTVCTENGDSKAKREIRPRTQPLRKSESTSL